MDNTLQEILEQTIKTLVKCTTNDNTIKADDALKLTAAALNVAQTIIVLKQ